MTTPIRIADSRNRRTFIGGSDARIIMGDRRGRPAPPLARETRRGRAGGPLRTISSSSSAS